jgi:hypothetical protein
MTITADSNLAELARKDEAGTKSVLARFAIIHCTGCSVPDQTVAQAAKAANLPVATVVKALQAEVKA